MKTEIYIHRNLESIMQEAAEQFPVIGLTGPRQTGKSTLLQKLFNDYHYITLDDPVVRSSAINDPGLFLEALKLPVIIDEIQYAPEILPYIKIAVDKNRHAKGQFILTGSQLFPLMVGITESLAGRIALFELLGFSFNEIKIMEKDHSINWLFEYMFKGTYPDPAVHDVNSRRYYSSYMQTYLERDIRQLASVHDLHQFHQFIEVLAARAGNVLNVSDVASDCGVSHTTAAKWVSLLESTRIIYLLRPYFKNISKRVIKSPKLYFTDTGLLAYLLKHQNAETLSQSFMNGAFFENLIVIEFLKNKLYNDLPYELYFYRDSNKNEIDLVLEYADCLKLYEIKLKHTLKSRDYNTISKFEPSMENVEKYVISCFDQKLPLAKNVSNIPWWEI